MNAPCVLIDTVRTLCTLAGLEDQIPVSWRGRDLFGARVPGAVFGVIHPPIQDDPSFHPGLMRVAVRTKHYRLDANWFITGARAPEAMQDGSLFDMGTDPQESHSVWADPTRAHLRRALMHKFDAWLSSIEVDPRLLDPSNAGWLFQCLPACDTPRSLGDDEHSGSVLTEPGTLAIMPSLGWSCPNCPKTVAFLRNEETGNG